MTETSTALKPPAPTPYEQFRSRHLRYYADGAAVLPCTDVYGRFNPAQPAGPWYDDHGPTFIVLDKERHGKGTRVLPDFDPVGTYIWLKHDQTGASLGHYYVVGGVNEDGEAFGSIPNRKLSVAVFK